MREPMITRTIVSTVGKVLCASKESGELFERDFTLSRTYPNDEGIIKVLNKVFESDIVVIKVITKDESVNLYGMSEAEFVAHANLLKAKTPKSEN